MRNSRPFRLATTFVVGMALLFSQLALAWYVCPREADVEAMAAIMDAGQPCEGMDETQPLLCHEYMASPAKTFEAAKLPGVGPFVIVQVVELPFVLVALEKHAIPPLASTEAQPPPDPLFLSTLRLRI